MSDLEVDRLRDGLAHILGSPREEGTVEMVVRRPAEDEREVVSEARLEPGRGLIGDCWSTRRNHARQAELTIMNARSTALFAGEVDRWPLAGDQLFVDFDLALEALPAGARLRVGDSVIEVSAKPHRGCAKFSARFGTDALRLVMSPEGQRSRLRGLNARVVEAGAVRPGDPVTRIASERGHYPE